MSYDTYWNNAANYDGTGFALMKAREQGDIEARANERRKKRACDGNGCRYEYGGECWGDPDKCEYWMDQTIMKAEIIREGDR